ALISHNPRTKNSSPKNSKESSDDGKRNHLRSYYPVRFSSAWRDHYFDSRRALGSVDRQRQQSVARIPRKGATDALVDGAVNQNPCHSPHTTGGARQVWFPDRAAGGRGRRRRRGHWVC